MLIRIEVNWYKRGVKGEDKSLSNSKVARCLSINFSKPTLIHSSRWLRERFMLLLTVLKLS